MTPVLAAEVIPAAPEQAAVETEVELAGIQALAPEVETAAAAMPETAEMWLYDFKCL